MTFISRLFNVILYENEENLDKGIYFVDILEKLCLLLNSNIDKQLLAKFYKDFLKTDENDFHILQNEMTKIINDYQKEGKSFYILIILSIFIHRILDERIIQKEFQQTLLCYGINKRFILIDTTINNEDINSSLFLCIDQNCNFFIKKTYQNAVSKEIIGKEIQIFKKNFKDDDQHMPSFIIHSETIINSDIYIPYFPFQILHIFLTQVNSGKIFFTNVDKIVMIKEIAIAFNQLHKNGIFHQNLNSSYIFVSETKNAYIGGFAHDPNVELMNSKNDPSIFYRDYDISEPTGPIICESNIEFENNKNIMYDVYSFGVLIYEIITAQYPSDLFIGKSRAQIIEILKEKYHEFLFDAYTNFDEVYKIIGIKKIIEKCMRTDNNNQSNYNFKDIINDIENLDLYKENKEEIENRILHSDNINYYKCNFSDIVVTYFLGNQNSLQIIKSFFQKFQKDIDYANLIKSNEYDDLLKIILEFFNFKNYFNDELGENLFFQSCFNAIIDDVLQSSINNEKILKDENHSLISLSREKNKISNIIPIASLKNFLNNFQINDTHLMIYFIAKEISMIHSHNIFHGELSLDSIGVYFNTETNSFMPAIVPFYIFYSNGKTENTDYYSKYYLSDYIKKMQKKDIKHFIKLVKILDEDLFSLISNSSDTNSIDDIIYEIFNTIIKNHDYEYKKQFIYNDSKYDYSLFQINFITLYSIFITFNKDEMIYKVFNYFFDQKTTILNLELTLHRIINFSNEKILNQNYKIANNFEKNEYNIMMLFLKIKENNSIILDISDQLEKERQEKMKNEDEMQALNIKKPRPFKLINYSLSEIKYRDIKNRSQINSYINRKIEITELEIKSIKFIIYRYIKTLNPELNYRVTVKIMNKFDSVRQKKNYKLADIEQIIKELNYNYEIINGLIIIIIDKKLE